MSLAEHRCKAEFPGTLSVAASTAFKSLFRGFLAPRYRSRILVRVADPLLAQHSGALGVTVKSNPVRGFRCRSTYHGVVNGILSAIKTFSIWFLRTGMCSRAMKWWLRISDSRLSKIVKMAGPCRVLSCLLMATVCCWETLQF